MANVLSACIALALLVVSAHSDTQCDPSWNQIKKIEKNRNYLISRESNTTSLRLLHVLFRHGDRTPDPIEFYPNDPYFNTSFYPTGLGQLTMNGKRTEYKIGTALRRRYGDFLGETFTPNTLDARSTDYNRTKMSLELMLAGLFPPSKSQTWNEDLPWQPIPYNYWPKKEDQLLIAESACPAIVKLYEDYIESDEFLQENDKYKDFYKYVSEKTGKKMSVPKDIYYLFFGLFTEEGLGLELPEWTKCVWPNAIQELAIKYYYNMAFNNEIISLVTGQIIEKVLDDSRKFIENELPEDRKIFIYSAHEFNVALALIGLNIFHPHVPPYGSYIVFELHEINGEYGFEILYQDYEFESPKLMEIPNCGTFCPLGKFYEIIKDHLPQKPCSVQVN